MGRARSGPEFGVNFGSDRVGSLHLGVGLGRVKKIEPTPNSDLESGDMSFSVDHRISGREYFGRCLYVCLFR